MATDHVRDMQTINMKFMTFTSLSETVGMS